MEVKQKLNKVKVKRRIKEISKPVNKTKPFIEIDLEQVEKLGGYGMTQKECCNVFNVSELTFSRRKDIITSYQKGKANLIKSLRATQVRVALQGNVTMLIWLGKQYLEQTEKINQSGLSEEETNKLRTFLNEQMTNNI